MTLELFDIDPALPPESVMDYSIERVDKGVCARFFCDYHYLQDKDFLFMYGFAAIYNNEIWGCIVFGIPNAKAVKGLYSEDAQKGVLEIVRLAFKPESPRNSCSRMISQSIKELQKVYPLRLIVTYADTGQGHEGTIYKASNFRYHGLTAQKTDFKFADGRIRKIKGIKYSEQEGEWIPRTRKHLYSLSVK